MTRKTCPLGAAVLLLNAFSVFALPAAAAAAVAATRPTKEQQSDAMVELVPARQVRSLGKRHFDQSKLQPQSNGRFVWLSPDDNPTTFAVSLDMQAQANETILDMEQFEEEIEHILCRDPDSDGDPDRIEISFREHDDYQVATQAWEWVNEAPERSFILIESDEACGPIGERRPWRVSNMTANDELSTIRLSLRAAEWKEVLADYILRFGNHGHRIDHAEYEKKVKRGFFDDAGDFFGDLVDKGKDVIDKGKDVVEDVVDKGKEVVDDVVDTGKEVFEDIKSTGEELFDKVRDGLEDLVDYKPDPVEINLARDFSGQLLKDSDKEKVLDISIDCVGCETKGKLVIDGEINGGISGLKAARITVKPVDISASMSLEVGLQLEAGKKPAKFAKELTLAGVAAPLVGFRIAKIIAIGPQLELLAGLEIGGVTGSGSINSGLLTAKIPNDSDFTLDLAAPDKKLQSKGWKPEFDREDPMVTGELEATISFYVEPAAAFVLSLFDKLEFNIHAGMKIPEFEYSATTIHDSEGGICEDSSAESAVVLQGHILAEIVVEGFTKVGNKQNSFLDPEPLYTLPEDIELPGGCYPIDKGEGKKGDEDEEEEEEDEDDEEEKDEEQEDEEEENDDEVDEEEEDDDDDGVDEEDEEDDDKPKKKLKNGNDEDEENEDDDEGEDDEEEEEDEDEEEQDEDEDEEIDEEGEEDEDKPKKKLKNGKDEDEEEEDEDEDEDEGNEEEDKAKKKPKKQLKDLGDDEEGEDDEIDEDDENEDEDEKDEKKPKKNHKNLDDDDEDEKDAEKRSLWRRRSWGLVVR